MPPREAFGIAFILLALAVPVIVICMVLFLALRFRHKQIMAAIEKGTPLSELIHAKRRGLSWIGYVTGGIAVVSIGLAFVFAGPDSTNSPMLFVAIILLGIGIAGIVRGLLYRKYRRTEDGRQITEPRP